MRTVIRAALTMALILLALACFIAAAVECVITTFKGKNNNAARLRNPMGNDCRNLAVFPGGMAGRSMEAQ